MKKKTLIMFCLLCLLFLSVFIMEDENNALRHLFDNDNKVTIVIDAGHGGFDPGKIGINHALEKDINLSIATKLKKLLEQNNILVVMTRTDGNGLYRQSDSDKKHVDMKKRVSIINSSDALFAISIHQNSFTEESSKGAQIFYYEASQEGKILAETIQERMKLYLNDGNHRLARPNSSYYLLRYTHCPLAIVECGFLSNRREAELLCKDDYQDKIAWAIYLGISEYIDNYRKDHRLPIAGK